MERYIKAGLNEFADHPFVGEIRGKGLLLGIELVSDKESKNSSGDGTFQCNSSKLYETGSPCDA